MTRGRKGENGKKGWEGGLEVSGLLLLLGIKDNDLIVLIEITDALCLV